MQAARGRRLAGERERMALGNRNRPLSTSYEKKRRGNKSPSRRSASSSEERQFYNDDEEFEHEVTDF